MLSILLTLQYKCYATAKSGNEKVKTGGNCPKDVACQKVSYNDMKKLYEGNIDDYVPKFSGKFAACVTSVRRVTY